jgi:3',5'-cyclic AMP phosphodiesterase CpdA
VRRAIVIAALLAVAQPAASAPLVPAPAVCERPEERVPQAPLNVELVTVGAHAFTVTWLTCDGQGHPLPSDTSIAFGTSLAQVVPSAAVTLERDVAFHRAEVTGLAPGTSYFYQVYSGGLPGRYDRYHPGAFTTLQPPPGRPLFSFAILADTHIGEHTSGLATSSPFDFPPGYTAERYAETMARAAVDQINREGVTFTMLPADSSSHGERDQVEEAKAIFDGLDRPYLVVRGSHDRPNQYPAAPQECPPDGDCFRAVFFPNHTGTAQPRHIFYARFKPLYTLIGLDSANLQTGMGELPDDELAFFDQSLDRADALGRPTFVFFHHPVSEWQSTLAIPPLVFGVNQEDAQQFLQIVGSHESVRAIVTAHTHRNWIGYSPRTGRIPILEVGPSKEYPGGFSLIQVYRDGFVRTFERLACGFCRQWIETTRWEYLGRYPDYTAGSLRDRNFVHRWDGPDVPAGPPSLPFNPWPPLVPMQA